MGSAWQPGKDLQHRIYLLVVGGRLMPHNYVSLVRCLGSVQRQCVEDEDEARELEEGAQKDFLDPNIHFYVPMYVE